MDPQKFIIAMVMVIAVVFGTSLVMTQLNEDYAFLSVDINENYTSAMKNITPIFDQVISSKAIVLDSEISEINTEASLFRGAFGFARSLQDYFQISKTLVNDALDFFNIPPQFYDFIVVLIAVGLIWAIVFLAFRIRPS